MRLAAITLMALLVAAGGSGCRKSGQKTVNVIGSTSIQPFAEMLAEEFNGRNPDFKVEVQGGGSTAGLQAVEDSLAQIGMCSRSLNKEEEQKFSPTVIARDGLAMVVHPTNKVSGLSRPQIKDIFAGK
ncbi:MAG: substrate-binding domain-containing protein [Planctomycetes bacterium]|nr:substrate-binding domain-containing protein [Planctomycetota bacterium]